MRRNDKASKNIDGSIKIRSVEASRAYMIEKGYLYRDGKTGNYISPKLKFGDATISESLFAQYSRRHGAKVDKSGFSYDFISMCFEFSVNADSIDPELKPRMSSQQIREYYYENGWTHTWCKRDKTGQPIEGTEITITYRMLMRSPGKAKDGTCIFVNQELHHKLLNYITIGLYERMPVNGAKLVELAAYDSLVTATAIDYITIPLDNIFVLKDEEVATNKKACVVRLWDIDASITEKDFRAFDPIVRQKGYTFFKKEQKANPELKFVDRNMGRKRMLAEYGIDLTECPVKVKKECTEKGCIVERSDSHEIKNVLWDGMGICDESIFPDSMDGFIYCRSHFFKSCLFRGNIQQYLKDYYGAAYDTTTLTDYIGRRMKASDIKVIITENSLKWMKFLDLMGRKGKKGTKEEGWKYFQRHMKEDQERFAIIKTGHRSKYDDLQRMSYQMVNSLLTTDREVLERIASTSIDYFNQMQKDDESFLKYLDQTATDKYCINHVLVDLYRQNEQFRYSDFYKEQRTNILCKLKNKRFKFGKLFMEGDNLTLCGNLIAMLRDVTGQDFRNEGCFAHMDDGIQCYTERFSDGEELAAFRSPHNSPNNIVHFKNVYPAELRKYFPKLGRNVIVVDNIGTDIQARLNGADYDTDSVFTTNQPDVVEIAKRAYVEFPTIVNAIPPAGSNQYRKDMLSFAQMDNSIAAAQYDIGESSNKSQLALSYWFDGGCVSRELEDVFIICSVLAQLSIDSAKRRFDIDISKELNRIDKLHCMKQEQRFPRFYANIQKDKNRQAIRKIEIKKKDIRQYECPMDITCEILNDRLIDKRKDSSLKSKIISLANIWADSGDRAKADRKQIARIRSVVENFHKKVMALNPWDDSYCDDRKQAYDDCIWTLRNINIKASTMSALVYDAITKDDYAPIQKELFVILYDKNKNAFLNCFKKSQGSAKSPQL